MSNEANAEVKDKAAKPVAWRVLVSEPGKDGATHTYIQYAYAELPKDIVDLGDYWDLSEGGSIVLNDAEGNFIEDQDCVIDHLACDYGGLMSCEIWNKRVNPLNPGEWVQWEANKVAITITALSEFPRVDVAKTLDCSCLSNGEKSRIKIYGKALFAEGDVDGCTCFRPNLANEINAKWTEYVQQRCDEEVEVKVKYQPSADSLVVNFTVTAPDEASLMSALRNLGVMQPEKIKPQVKRGEGDRMKEITVSFSLTDKLS